MREDLYDRLVAAENPVLKCVSEENQYLPGQYETAHNIGRWWEAALQLQSTVGMEIPERTDRAMSLNLRALTCNRYGLLLNDREIFPDGVLNYHNLREALLAYASLIEYRGSSYAAAAAERLLDTIGRRFFESALSDEEICRELNTVISDDPAHTRPDDDPYRLVDDTVTTGRAIEGMYRCWIASGSARALDVMRKAVDFHRKRALCRDGGTPEWMKCPKHPGHNHSYLGTLRGLLLYAVRFGDEELKDSIFLTYKNSIPKYNCDRTGFAPHDLAQPRFSDDAGDPAGDHASCADVIYIAFLLAVRCGHPELLDDVERLIRARLFRFQCSSGEEAGAWGIYGGYFGTSSTIDVFCLIAATLCRIYREITEEKDDGVYVHLNFSCDAPYVRVVSVRDDMQRTTVTPKTDKITFVRIPSWCGESGYRVADQHGTEIACTAENGYIAIPGSCTGASYTVTYALPAREETVETWVSKTKYAVNWKGDTITDFRKLK